MATPRRDAYGRPLPELMDVRQELLRDRPQNRAQERFLLQCLEDWMGQLLRRGVYAKVTVSYTVQDGILQRDLAISITRQYRTPDTPEP